jgi:hypothetical protein
MDDVTTKRGRPIVLFSQMSRPRQLWESVGGAILTGIICGALLEIVWWGYVIAVLVTFVGGAPSGTQHRTLRGALLRGFVGGVVWALCVIAVVAIVRVPPTVALPDPLIAFLPWGFVPSCVVAAIAWTVTRRKRSASLETAA